VVAQATPGDLAHIHTRDDIFYVLEGTMSLLAGEEWIHAKAGSFVLVPGGVKHDFENRGDVRAGVLNFYAPGTFEPHMAEVSNWFISHPPGDA
jgi:mannose-6-phosphate isomerase-like protein (cupin superfamily)